MLLVIVSSSNSQSLSGWGGYPNDGRLRCDCEEPILGLKCKPGGRAATKDDAMMRPAETRNVISYGHFGLDESRRLLVEDGIELGGAQTLDILIEPLPCPNEVVRLRLVFRPPTLRPPQSECSSASADNAYE
jgi:hypothetical protein